jgi:anti-sigma regulatory factor (Ser/Thr protein kinase)
VLLRRELALGVQIISVAGPLEAEDVPVLRQAIAAAAALEPRGVLLDLSAVERIAPAAMTALGELRQLTPGWPSPSLQVCCTSQEVADSLRSWLPVHPRREDGMAHVDDRRSAPRRIVDLTSDLQSPAAARAATAEFVAAEHLELLGEDLSLVVSELVTNAVRHAQPPVRLEMQADADRVTIAVADGCPGRPRQRAANEDAEGGRGMFLVDLLAAETGVRPNPPGKTVWAALPRRS